MSSAPPFERLIRFQEQDGQSIRYGDLPLVVPNDGIIGGSVEVLNGDIQSGFQKAGTKAAVGKLLSPLPSASIILCIGLNYRQHATEANLTVPTLPVVFCKPPDALAGPFDNIHVHPEAQSQLDYEGELTVVIGSDAKNVKAADALDYVLGYTVGNDLSARNYQRPPTVSGGQYCYAKSFDSFAPVGPCLIAAPLVDPQQLHFVTTVNGQVRQKTSTSDMIWTVRQIIEHLSRGTTLRRGTHIMTGTPSGVGLFMEPQASGFLKHGDVVEIEMEKIGSIKNQIVFD
ncbi:hypothetical protein LTR53_003637 [Teratosphaeriaceae sp. CCFEE 6253]|nr:hypothetical protein LTR53_003637 [Teratosphaeriaceae sp. CCFEE 6253]